jgi:DNA-binding NarL/FixJ family response regulator
LWYFYNFAFLVGYWMKKAFIIADNQDITKIGLMALLAERNLAEVVLVASNRKELQALLREHPDAVVVLDYTLFDFTSMQQMLFVKDSALASSWLLLSDELSAGFLRHVLVEDPSMSVVMKGDSADHIFRALLAVATGAVFRCDFAVQALRGGLSDDPVTDKLTASEKVVLREIALGKTTKEIAWEKNLSFHTINAHRKNIFRKLEVNSVHEAIRYAFRAGLIDVSDYSI